MHPKLIIFDWDGTLADTTGPIIAAFRHSFRECGLPEPDADTIRSLIGYSLPQIVYTLAPEADRRTHELLIETYTASSFNPNNQNMKLFDSALPCLTTLKQQGYWLAVATGKGRSGLDKAITQTGTADFWLATTCASEQPSKPAPDMVLHLCDQLGLMPSETLVVGDTSYDLDMAANAGAAAVGVATGAHSKALLLGCKPLAVIDGLAELPPLLAGLPK